MKKITKKEYFEMLKGLAMEHNREDLVNFIDKEVDILTRKRKSPISAEKQKVNNNIKETIIKFLLDNANEKFTITEIQKGAGLDVDYSNQKIKAMVYKLIETGEVKKVTIKSRNYFTATE